jgi:O-antigen ligase
MKHLSYYYFVAIFLLAFVLPGYFRLPAMLIISVAIIALFLKKIDYKYLLENKLLLYIVLFYCAHLIGTTYAAEKSQSFFDLEVKLSLLVLPFSLIYYNSNKSEIQQNKLYGFYIYGCTITVLFCLINAAWCFIDEKIKIHNGLYNLNYGINFFLTSRLSTLMHPSYFAMYLSLALALIFNRLGTANEKRFDKLTILLYVLTIILLASKSGLISLFAVFSYHIHITKNYKLLFYSILLSSFSFILLMFFSPEFYNRLKQPAVTITTNQINPSSIESTSARVLCWKSAIEVYLKKPILGFGTGNGNIALLHQYEKNGYKAVLEKKLNAHNQYLQTGLSNGLVGIVFLLLIFLQAYIQSKNNILLFNVTFILAINFLFESMLETQSGVIFFAFWFSVLSDNKKS